MHPKLAEAVQDKIEHPEKTYKELRKKHGVPESTINDHVKGTHSAQDDSGPRALPIPMEQALIKQINDYASRGTLLTPAHVKSLAERSIGHTLGPNWATTFIKRYKDQLSSRFRSHQELARLKADTPECRRAFYELMDHCHSSYTYSPYNIYNMDETGFKLGEVEKRRRMAGEGYPTWSQAKPTNQAHITVVATIGTQDAPVPPLLIYSGVNLQQSWYQIRRDDVKQLSTTSESGWTNSYIQLKWLEDCFDPYTKDRAGENRRLLLLDGAEPHIKVTFLEACWVRKIVCVILPAHMSGILQPLDVDFFRQHKAAYRKLVDNYQIASFASDINKGLFYGWHQQAWRQTATSRQIRSAWRKSGMWPLDRKVLKVKDVEDQPQPSTPTHNSSTNTVKTPTSLHSLRTNNTLVRTGEVDPKDAYLKLEKAYETTLAEKTFAQVQLELYQSASELNKEAGGSRKAVRHPHGELYDPEYQANHPEELAERKQREEQAAKKRKKAVELKKKVELAARAVVKAMDDSPSPPSS